LFVKCDADDNFIAQVKKNGWRVQIHKDHDDVKFYSRHNKRLESLIPQCDWKTLTNLVINNIKQQSVILDGELLYARTDIKNVIYLWDIFETDDQQLDICYRDRKQILNQIVTNNEQLYVATDYNNNFIDVWNRLKQQQDEGIVIKDLNERLYINFNKTIESSRQFKILKDDIRNKVK
jgi:ATP-dependent DNA ligase